MTSTTPLTPYQIAALPPLPADTFTPAKGGGMRLAPGVPFTAFRSISFAPDDSVLAVVFHDRTAAMQTVCDSLGDFRC